MPKLNYRVSEITLLLLGVAATLCGLLARTLVEWRIYALAAEHNHVFGSLNAEQLTQLPLGLGQAFQLYRVLQGAGRIAFPILAFLLIQHLLQAPDVLKLAAKLGFAAVAAQLIYNYLFYFSWISFYQQNMLFTLLLGVAAVIAMERYYQNIWVRFLLAVLAVALAEFGSFENGGLGVALMLLFYLFRGQRLLMIGLGILMSIPTITGPLAFLPIALYDPDTLKKRRAFWFYLYPLTLVILLIMRSMML